MVIRFLSFKDVGNYVLYLLRFHSKCSTIVKTIFYGLNQQMKLSVFIA